MTTEQIALVKKTWKIFRDIDPVLIGDVFYSKLFVDVPQVKYMFRITRAEQSRKLIEMLNAIIGRLDKLDELTEDIRQLAQRHVRYGVQPFHYKQVGVALLWTLQQGLGTDWSKDVETAWEACYKILADIMISASGYEQLETAPSPLN
jgi:hemoglobin-like flavoprotein